MPEKKFISKDNLQLFKTEIWNRFLYKLDEKLDKSFYSLSEVHEYADRPSVIAEILESLDSEYVQQVFFTDAEELGYVILKDPFGCTWISEPTSEQSADLHIYLNDYICFYSSVSIETDAETGDSRVVVGETYVESECFPYEGSIGGSLNDILNAYWNWLVEHESTEFIQFDSKIDKYGNIYYFEATSETQADVYADLKVSGQLARHETTFEIVTDQETGEQSILLGTETTTNYVLENELDSISGTDDGTNWQTITINGTTRVIPGAGESVVPFWSSIQVKDTSGAVLATDEEEAEELGIEIIYLPKTNDNFEDDNLAEAINNDSNIPVICVRYTTDEQETYIHSLIINNVEFSVSDYTTNWNDGNTYIREVYFDAIISPEAEVDLDTICLLENDNTLVIKLGSNAL